jgi:hypothetical protein
MRRTLDRLAHQRLSVASLAAFNPAGLRYRGIGDRALLGRVRALALGLI